MGTQSFGHLWLRRPAQQKLFSLTSNVVPKKAFISELVFNSLW